MLLLWPAASIAATLLAACAPTTATQPPQLAPTSAPTVAPTLASAPADAAPSRPTVSPLQTAAGAPRLGGSFRFFAWTEDPPSLDPYQNVGFRTQGFAAFFYSRLLMSKKGPGIPGQAYIMDGDLAEAWQVGQDGTTYSFRLRPDTRWHNRPPLNGRPLIAQDVVWSFERFMKVSPQRAAFDIVAAVSAPDDRTVQFSLKDVYAPFEAAIGAPVF